MQSVDRFYAYSGRMDGVKKCFFYSTLSFVGKTLNFVVIYIIMNIYFLNRGVRLCLYQKE